MSFLQKIEEFVDEEAFWAPIDLLQNKIRSQDFPALIKFAKKNKIIDIRYRIECNICGTGFLRITEDEIKQFRIGKILQIECNSCFIETNTINEEQIKIDVFFNVNLFELQPKKQDIDIIAELKEMYQISINEKNRNKKGGLFEDFAAEYIGNHPGFKFDKKRLRTELKETDAIFRIDKDTKHDLDLESNLCLVEAKNQAEKVGADVVTSIFGQLYQTKARLGIIIAANEFTKSAFQLCKTYYNTGDRTIIFLNRNDFLRYFDNEEDIKTQIYRKVSDIQMQK